MRKCDDGYPTCRNAEAGGDWCKNECVARDSVNGNVNGLAIMSGGRLVDVAALESLLREVNLALNDLLEKKPMLGAVHCGTTTLGNLRVDVHALVTPNAELRRAATEIEKLRRFTASPLSALLGAGDEK
jgi:hypothetical protein